MVGGLSNSFNGLVIAADNDKRSFAIGDVPALYAIGIAALYLRMVLESTVIFDVDELLSDAIMAISIILLLLHCLINLDKYGKNAFGIVVILAYLAYNYVRTGETLAFVSALILVSSSTAGKPRQLVTCWVLATSILLLTLSCLYVLTLMLSPASITLMTRFIDGYRLVYRHAIFFGHPNMTAATFMMLSSAILYLRMGRIGLFDIVRSVFLAVAIYVVTNSRTSAYLQIASPFIFFLQQSTGILCKKWARRCLAALPPVMFAIVYLVSGPLYRDSIGLALSTRVWLWHSCYANQGITFLGQRFQQAYTLTVEGWYGSATTLDNFYAFGLYVAGIIWSLLFCLVIYRATQFEDGQASAALPIIILSLAFGLTEVHVLDFVCTPSLLVLSPVVLPNSGRHSQHVRWRMPVRSMQIEGFRDGYKIDGYGNDR